MGIWPKLASGIGASKRIFQMLDRERSVRFCGGLLPPDIHEEHKMGHIVFRNVAFQYPHRNELVLQDINLEVLPGETHALVGPSGSGKSTIINLLNAMYYVTSGSLTFGGTEISELDPFLYRRILGYVPQEPVLFHRTVRENIAYGTNSSYEQIAWAAQKAYALDFIMNKEDFPEGFDTYVGVRGGTLSGGQKQRIVIARALLRNPKVLLLDEATSALDSESEFYVQEALKILMKGRTTVAIAHRLSTVREATKLHVISKGLVVESGSHEELLAIKDGAYAKLARTQFNLNVDIQTERPTEHIEEIKDAAELQKVLQAEREEAQRHLEHFEKTLLNLIPADAPRDSPMVKKFLHDVGEVKNASNDYFQTVDKLKAISQKESGKQEGTAPPSGQRQPEQ